MFTLFAGSVLPRILSQQEPYVAAAANNPLGVASASHRPSSMRDAADAAREFPLRVLAIDRPCLWVSQKDFSWIRSQIQPAEPVRISPSYCLHVLRAHGLNARFSNEAFPTSDALLQTLFDSEDAQHVFGESALVSVSTGARYRTGKRPRTERWQENHRDQNLASFAELGLPLSTKLIIEGEQHTLRDVLRDSIGNFHLRQEELAWTALAYALYLPPHSEWANKYRERYTFDDLTIALLNRRMINGSCGGCHILFALTFIARADEVTPILSAKVRKKVLERLEFCIRLAARSQNSDGSWPGDWCISPVVTGNYSGESPPATALTRLIVTGHLAEWMLYLPNQLEVPQGTLNNASAWLLKFMKQLTDEEKSKQICPCTHGICVLRRTAYTQPR